MNIRVKKLPFDVDSTQYCLAVVKISFDVPLIVLRVLEESQWFWILLFSLSQMVLQIRLRNGKCFWNEKKKNPGKPFRLIYFSPTTTIILVRLTSTVILYDIYRNRRKNTTWFHLGMESNIKFIEAESRKVVTKGKKVEMRCWLKGRQLQLGRMVKF